MGALHLNTIGRALLAVWSALIRLWGAVLRPAAAVTLATLAGSVRGVPAISITGQVSGITPFSSGPTRH